MHCLRIDPCITPDLSPFPFPPQFVSDDDEMGDFIVDGAGGAGRRRRMRSTMPGLSSRAMQEAFDLFGDVDGMMDVFEQSKKQQPGVSGQGICQSSQQCGEARSVGEQGTMHGMEYGRGS